MLLEFFARRPVIPALGLTALLWWPLLFSDRFTYVHTPDLTGQVLPWYQVQSRAWLEHVFPTWDPYAWGGQPLLAQAQPGAAFPLNWPLFWTPFDAEGKIQVRLVDLHYAAMHLLAALFAFLLARDLGRGGFASMVAGVAYACAGYVGSIGWPQMLAGAVWLPLTLLCFHRAWRLRSLAWAVLCGGSAGMSLLSGHHQTPYFGLLALGLVVCTEWFQDQDKRPRRIAILALVAGTAVLVGALQIMPALEYGGQAYRWVSLPDPVGPGDEVPYAAHAENRLYPITLLGLVVEPLAFQVNPFLGWLILLAALYGVATAWADARVRLYSLLGGAALLFSFGPFTPLHGWVYAFLPFADKARSPSHAIYVFQLAAILLAAFGIERFLQRRDEDAGLWRVAKRALIVFAFGSAALVYSRTPMGEMEADPGDAILYSAVMALGVAGIIAAWNGQALARRGVQALMLAVLACEMYSNIFPTLADKDDPKQNAMTAERYEEYRGVMEYLQSRPGPFRFELHPADGLNFNLGAWYGVEQIDGFLASVDRGYYDFFGKVGWTEGRLLMNTVYVVAQEKQREEQELVYEDPHTSWNVFRNPDARPRAWMEPQDGCSVAVDKPTAAGLPVRVSGVCSGRLVLAEPFVQGRLLRLEDGTTLRPEPHRAGLQSYEIDVSGGWSALAVYESPAVAWGGLLTLLGFAACLGAGFVVRR